VRPGEQEEDVKWGFSLWVWTERYGVWGGYARFEVSLFEHFLFLGGRGSFVVLEPVAVWAPFGIAFWGDFLLSRRISAGVVGVL